MSAARPPEGARPAAPEGQGTPASPAPLHAGPPAPRGPLVMAVNAGSSSLKFGLYPRGDGRALWQGLAEGLEPGGQPRLRVDGAVEPCPTPPGGDPFEGVLSRLAGRLRAADLSLVAVAHRIVHGGDHHVAPCLIDDAVLAGLRRLSPLAPLHQPHNLDAVAAFARALPGVPQVGCFDTAFHATLPRDERRLPLPPRFASEGVRRYGFHGLSYAYVSRMLGRHSTRMGQRALLAHIGNGVSLCALRGGVSVATSMGFSALEGPMMGTRSGSLDPGVVLHLWRQGWTLDQVETLLYRQSGLAGVSGLGADMRTLRASTAPAAREAIALFVHRLRREAGALIALLGGVDLVAFAGGIGEHDAALRDALLAGFAFAGLRLDAQANRQADPTEITPLHAFDSAAEIWLVPTDEGREAASAAFALLAGADGLD